MSSELQRDIPVPLVLATVVLLLFLIPWLSERIAYRGYTLKARTYVIATAAVLVAIGFMIRVVSPNVDWSRLYFSILAGTLVWFLGSIGAYRIRRGLAWAARDRNAISWANRWLVFRLLAGAISIIAVGCGAISYWVLTKLG